MKRNLRKRIDVYLQERLKGISRNRVRKLIELGGVTINGKQPKPSTTAVQGDVIDVILPAPAIRTIEPEEIPLHIVYEDDHFIIINKQAGLLVHPARSHLSGTLLNALAFHFKQQREAKGETFKAYNTRGFRKSDPGTPASQAAKSSAPTDSSATPADPEADPVTVDGLSEVGATECRPGIVHRLDRYTTGVMVVAKADEAHYMIAKQFERRQTTKAYLALVHGNFSEPAGVINEPIGKHPTIREAYGVRRDRLSKDSVTIYRVREQYEGYSLVELELRTGRTHQIRVHLTYLGYPIVGDITYGGEAIGPAELDTPILPAGHRKYLTFARKREEGLKLEKVALDRGEDILLMRPSLHATLLGFTHPGTEQPVRFTAPLHQPMLDVIRTLRQRRVDKPVATDGTFIDLTQAVPDEA